MKITRRIRAGLGTISRSRVRKRIEIGLLSGKGAYRLEAVRACICGGTIFLNVAVFERFRLPIRTDICLKCGLVQQWPRLTDDSLTRFYRRDYRLLYRHSSRIDEAYFERSLRRGARIVQFLNERLKESFGEVIEIGCGPGGILKAFQNQGSNVRGCELDRACVRFCDRKDISVVQGTIDDLLEFGGGADLVVLSHLLEHVPCPIQLLDNVTRLLAPDGCVYVEVPGIRNGIPFVDQLQIAHTYYYDSLTLQMVMRKAGFSCVYDDERIQAIYRPGPYLGISDKKLQQNAVRNVESLVAVDPN